MKHYVFAFLVVSLALAICAATALAAVPQTTGPVAPVIKQHPGVMYLNNRPVRSVEINAHGVLICLDMVGENGLPICVNYPTFLRMIEGDKHEQ